MNKAYRALLLALALSWAGIAQAQTTTFYTGSDDAAVFDVNPNPGTTYSFSLDAPAGFHVGDTVTSLVASKLFNSSGNIPMTALLVFYDATSSPTISQSCMSDQMTPNFSAGYAASSSVEFTFSTPCVVEGNAVVIGQIEAQSGNLYYDYHRNAYAAGGVGNLVGLAGTISGIPGVPPHITRALLRSSNASTTLAAAGDDIVLDFDVDEPVQTPHVTIAGHIASVATTSGNSFEASTTLVAGDAQGPVAFTIDVTSTTRIVGFPTATTTDGSAVFADLTAPTLTADSRTTNEQNPLIGGSASDAESGIASVTAVVNGTTYAASTTGSTWSVTLPNLPEGVYPIAVTATDRAGNVSAASASLTIDRTPPALAITGGPADGSLTNSTSATFIFTADAPTVCALDGGALAACSGSFATSSLSAGTHLFTVSATDDAGNTTSLSRSWSVDTAAPILKEVSIATTTTDTTPTYVFSSSKAGTIAYGGSCTSTTTQAVAGDNTIAFNQLALGTYGDCTLTVTDAAGNVSNVLAVSSFTITQATPTTPPPGDKDECKKGGWRLFAALFHFRNQGDCVSSIVSHKYKGDHDADDGDGWGDWDH